MSKKILAVFAHPDDEAFGPSATLAKYASEGAEIHLLLATKGEAGQNFLKKRTGPLWKIREKEAKKSAKNIGIKKLKFLGFIDGMINQNDYHKIARKIISEIKNFNPDVIITFEPHGISGHLDHIAMSFITTYAYLKSKSKAKLYYHCLPDFGRQERMNEYFVYFPEGYKENEITTKIDISKYWDKKKEALMAHESQIKDIKETLKYMETRPKIDFFILKYPESKTNPNETDLFS